MVDDKLPAPNAINPAIHRYLSDMIMKSMDVKSEKRYQSVGDLSRDLSGNGGTDNKGMLRKIVMICAPVIGIAVVVICIVLVIQLSKSEPKRRNTTENSTDVVSEVSTESLTENITDSTAEMSAGISSDDQSKPALKKAGNVKKFDNTENSNDESAADTGDAADYYATDSVDVAEQSSSLDVKISAPPEGTSIRYEGTFPDGEPFEDVFYGVDTRRLCYVYINDEGGMMPGTATIKVYEYSTDELLGEASVEIK